MPLFLVCLHSLLAITKNQFLWCQYTFWSTIIERLFLFLFLSPSLPPPSLSLVQSTHSSFSFSLKQKPSVSRLGEPIELGDSLNHPSRLIILTWLWTVFIYLVVTYVKICVIYLLFTSTPCLDTLSTAKDHRFKDHLLLVSTLNLIVLF